MAYNSDHGVNLDFYPRSPRGERLAQTSMDSLRCSISIHAPREGSDQVELQDFWLVKVISIHAPREGSDRLHGSNPTIGRYFYPRSPRGERLPVCVLSGTCP